MNVSQPVPVFDHHFPELNRFILELVQAYDAGALRSWDDLEARVTAYFTPQIMEAMESMIAGWQKMASYSGGITLTHVMCVFLGLFMLPEFAELDPQSQQLAKWIILLHDVDKFHIRGQKDTMHAFRSAVLAARTLPNFDFPTRPDYHKVIDPWSDYTTQAFFMADGAAAPTPDNSKLPKILKGIELMFGDDTPAALIVKTILFHLSFHENDEYPTPAPFTDREIQRYVSPDLLPFSRVMMLSDNEGWTMFEPERAAFRQAALSFFARVENGMPVERYDDLPMPVSTNADDDLGKEFWRSLANNDYAVPADHQLLDLTLTLFGYLSSPDPELRDDIAYTVYANWLKREMYTQDEVRDHVQELLANLEQGIGDSGTDSVFVRAFSILLLAEIVHNDNKKPLLEKDQVDQILAKGLWYLGAEKDPRGYIAGKGWAHALAHMADLMLVLGRNRHLSKEDLLKILHAISDKIVRATQHIYIHGEDERLARAVVQILRRDLLSVEEIRAWTETLTAPGRDTWHGAYEDEERNRAFQNTRNLLRSIYLEILDGEAETPSTIQDVFFHALRELRPY